MTWQPIPNGKPVSLASKPGKRGAQLKAQLTKPARGKASDSEEYLLSEKLFPWRKAGWGDTTG